MTNIRTILSANEDKKRLNILVIGATHERYEQQLCLTGHKFYSYNDSIKQWNTQYGAKPENYIVLNAIPSYIRPDLVLTHVSGNRLETANELANHFGVNVIRHTHTLPESIQEKESFHWQSAHIDTFISDYSRKAWGAEGIVINHGLDTEFWRPVEIDKTNEILSVVNHIATRDWACGFKIYQKIKESCPDKKFVILGNNPGLSLPSASLKSLRGSYCKSMIFLNTSQFSPIPMSVLEAMACGALVISSNTCMIPEIIKHNRNGLLANTSEEFVKCIEFAIDNPEKSAIMRDNARQTIVESFNINQFIDNWNNVFRKALVK
jgi:glycosyltransferase involved in cell wall biosynthesis